MPGSLLPALLSRGAQRLFCKAGPSLSLTNASSCPGHRHSHLWLRTSEQGGSRWSCSAVHILPPGLHTGECAPVQPHSHVASSLAAAPGGLPHARPPATIHSPAATLVSPTLSSSFSKHAFLQLIVVKLTTSSSNTVPQKHSSPKNQHNPH